MAASLSLELRCKSGRCVLHLLRALFSVFSLLHAFSVRTERGPFAATAAVCKTSVKEMEGDRSGAEI